MEQVGSASIFHRMFNKVYGVIALVLILACLWIVTIRRYKFIAKSRALERIKLSNSDFQAT